jgi:acyl-CoA synthetase (AMP-forming)/AMP-acid ligase II
MPDIHIHIGEMLARNARLYPDEIALIERNAPEKKRTEITWKEFDARANRFANVLLQMGVQKGDKVGHWMQNSINWLIVYFGIVRTGAWVVPLNFRFTSDEVKYCGQTAEPAVFVFDEEFTPRVEPVKGHLASVKKYICVGKECPSFALPFDQLMDSSSDSPVATEINLTDPCGLYFTSGTTGRPKPILLTHHNMLNAAVTENAHHRQTKEDVFILMPPLYHTGAKMHWFGHLIVGSRAVILKGISPEWIFEAVSEEGGTVLWSLVPWIQDILIKLDAGSLKLQEYKLDQWRLMHMGAQPIPQALIRHWRKYFPQMQYDTSYGLSESTGPGCVNLGIGNEQKIGAIGRPGFNWEYKVVDDSGIELKKGEIGELCVRGNGVMREYYKNPEATAKALREGWLFTGDMVKVDDDGFIWIVDRKKDVIISGGENIFPVEVEDFLHQHPAIKDCAVIGISDERQGEIVTAVVEPVPGKNLTEKDVLAYCEGLQKYKRPKKVFFDESLRNPTGKLEKVRLRKKYGGSESAVKI